MSFKITWRTHVVCTFIAVAMVIIMYPYVNRILDNYIYSGIILYPTGHLLINFYIQILIILFIVSATHELIHGFMYWLYGGTVKYGFKGIFAYTQEMSGIAIGRIKFLIILLAPLVVISLLSLLFGYIGGLTYLISLLGSSGDVYMALYLCKYKQGCRIVDRGYGFDIIAS